MASTRNIAYGNDFGFNERLSSRCWRYREGEAYLPGSPGNSARDRDIYGKGMKVITLTIKTAAKWLARKDIEIRQMYFGYADRILDSH